MIGAVLTRAFAQTRELRERPLVALMLQVAATLLVFIALDRFLSGAGALSAQDYRNPLVTVQLLGHIGIVKLSVLIVGAAVLLRYGTLSSRWGSLELGKPLQYFVVLQCLFIAWPLVANGYNFYFDQAYLVDRVLVVALVFLIGWHPVFVFPFLLLVYGLLGQLTEPAIGGSIAAHKLQLIRAISLFGAAFLVQAATGYRRSSALLLLLCCHVAAAYWLPALAKFQIDWLAITELRYIPLAAYAHGWLAIFSPAEIVSFAQTLAAVDGPARVAVLAMEAACLLFLWHRRLTLALLSSVIVFHFLVLLIYGFFFWTWIALDVGLFWLLLRANGPEFRVLQQRAPFLASVVLIGLGAYWSKPPALAWYDVPLSYTYQLRADTGRGDELNLHPRFFGPYEDSFAMASFSYLGERNRLPIGPYGVTKDAGVVEALARARNADDIFRLENQIGRSRHKPQRADRFRTFIQHYFSHYSPPGLAAWSNFWRPPPQFWSLAEGVDRLAAPRPQSIRVVERTSFFDGQALTVIREQEVARIAIRVTEEPLP